MTTDQTDRHIHEVIIVGGGPSGLATAAELAFHGVASTVIEPREVVNHDRPRAKTTSIRTMEHFRRWGIAEAVRTQAELKPEWSQKVIFCDTLAGPVITEFDEAFGLCAGAPPFASETSQQVPQPVVEDVLRDHLATTGLVTMRLGERALSIAENVDFVEVVTENDAGATTTLRSRYVVGCDGGWSPSREAVGARLEGSSATHSNLNVVFFSAALTPAIPDAVHYWTIGPDTPGVMGKLDHSGLWWASLAAAGEITDAREVTRLLAALAGVSTDDFDIEIRSMDPWTPRMLLADRFASERIFLVGESAHLNPPFGGHGFNTCVGDAVNIGWKLAAVLRGWGGPELLASYEAERRHVARETIESAAANLRASGVGMTTDAAILQQSKAEEFHSLGLVLGYSYAGSPIVATGQPPLGIDVTNYQPQFTPGARLPHTWFEDGRSLYDLLDAEFTLLVSDAAQAPAALNLLGQNLDSAIPITTVVVPAEVTGPHDFVLVRPDQHIAWTGDNLTGLDTGLVTGHGSINTSPIRT